MPNSSEKQTVGILTGGGIAPGLNAVLSTATRQLQIDDHRVIGIPKGWEGMLDVRDDIVDLSGMSRRELHDLISTGGTTLRSSRTKIKSDQFDRVAKTAAAYGLTGIIAIGGGDTLGQARELHEAGIIRTIGVPKTIDNDVQGTDRTFGFETAYHTAAEAIRNMRTEATSMSRVAIVEVMGRSAGWIALYGGEAGGADITLIPEFPIDEAILMERVKQVFNERGANGHPTSAAVIALAEGYFGEEPNEKDMFGHGKTRGAAQKLAAMVKERIGLDTQELVLGYQARNGPPMGHDAIFASSLGAHAGLLASHGLYGRMVALRKGEITDVPLSEVAGGRIVTEDLYDRKTMSMRLVARNVQQTIRETRERMG